MPAYQTAQACNVTVMTTVADYQIRSELPDYLPQSDDGRKVKTVPERNKSNIMSDCSGFMSYFTFSLQASKTECPCFWSAVICARACNSWPPISGEDSVNKIFIINSLVILAPYEEPVMKRKMA